MMYGWGDGGWWMMGISSFIGLLIVVALVWVIVSISRGSGASAAGGPGHARALLDERFARGEIDADEYNQRLSVLSGRK